MTLGQARIGDVVSIKYVGGERSFRRRLMELGLVSGTQVELVRQAPLRDPLELSVRGSRLSIRRQEALAIEVKRVASEAAYAPAALAENIA